MTRPPSDEHDPFAPIDVPTRGGVVFVFLAFVAAAAAVWNILPLVTGPLGMILGLIGHLKQHRWGFAAAVVAAVATFVGVSLQLLIFNPFSSS